MTREEPLAGGIANAGRVTRMGAAVLRPANPHSATIHAFLASVRTSGFTGASMPLGIDADGRERLEFIDGDVAVPPYPAWAQTDDALASIAELMRDFHTASRHAASSNGSAWNGSGSDGAAWSTEMQDPDRDRPASVVLVCHNDVCLENVVFRAGRAVGLLDFDFAAPGRAVYDVAQMARMCVPVDDDLSAARLGWCAANRPARLRMVADTYGLDGQGRHDLLAALSETIGRGGEFVRRRVEAGDANFIRMWNDIGGMERFDRRRTWWAEHRSDFVSAVA